MFVLNMAVLFVVNVDHAESIYIISDVLCRNKAF